MRTRINRYALVRVCQRVLAAERHVSAGVGIPAHFAYGFATLGHLGPAFVLLITFAIAAALSYPTSSVLHPKRPNNTLETDARNIGARGSP